MKIQASAIVILVIFVLFGLNAYAGENGDMAAPVKAGIVIKLQRGLIAEGELYDEETGLKSSVVLSDSMKELKPPSNEKVMFLSIALSFTAPSGEPVYTGVRIVSDALAFGDEKTIFGFRNEDGITHVRFPTHDVIIGDRAYTYMKTVMDRQENGMFYLSRILSSGPNAYYLGGVFYAQGHLFLISEIMHVNEEKICYAQSAQQEEDLNKYFDKAFSNSIEAKSMAQKIIPGMTRVEVEAIFKHQDGGKRVPSQTRYYEDPGVLVEVPFDQTGGNWNKNNRVNGPVKVYLGAESFE